MNNPRDLLSAPAPAPWVLFPGELSNRPLSWSDERAADFAADQYKANIFVPSEEYEETLSRIEVGLSEWGAGFSKRRAIEKKTAEYIRYKVAPLNILSGAFDIADRLDSCRLKGLLGVDVLNGRRVVQWEEKCGLKNLCPDESRADQKRLADRYVPAADAWLSENAKRQFQYAVFEPVNVPLGELKAGIKNAFHELRCLIRHKSFKNIKGCFAALECPLSRDGKSWNVHINCLFLVDGNFDWKKARAEYGQRIHFESTQSIVDKTQAYLDKRNGGYPVRISRKDVLVCAFREIIKYSSKHISSDTGDGKTDAPGIIEWPPELFVEWYLAHKGLRRCRSYGALYDVPKPDKLERNVQWIGSMNFEGDSKSYVFRITKRPAIISLQGDKLTKLKPISGKQTSLNFHPPPAG